jgi:nicotinamide-nucleotide amidase
VTSPATRIGPLLKAKNACLAVAESCTGGLIAARITDIAGSSEWFERGLVTYSNRAKQELLGVAPAILEQHGAVSRECAEAMARGLLVMTPADWGVAVTGIAGPGGGTPEKPVGTVWIAVDLLGEPESKRFSLIGGRDEIRRRAAQAALAMVRRVLTGERARPPSLLTDVSPGS